jgi:membrane fusion protein, multidrug efflux system
MGRRTARPARVGLVLAVVLGLAWPAAAQDGPVRPRGVVRSLSEATISGELAARIVSMPFREGQSFAAGDELVVFDCARFKAEVDSLRADLAVARSTFEGSRDMERYKAIGARDLAIASARMDKATAELGIGLAKIETCSIRAPFDGVVTEKLASEHEVTSPSAPLLRIVDDRRLEVELIAPSRWLGWLEVGQPFVFHVDDIDRDVPAAVTRLAGTVDAVSQTVKLFAAFSVTDPAVRPGMSGSGVFQREDN